MERSCPNSMYQEKDLFNNSIKIFKDGPKNISLNHDYKNIIYYPSSTKEWSSSVYSYNKSYTKPLIVYDNRSNYLVEAYVNMSKNRVKKFKRRRNNKIRYSANKLYPSEFELYHRNTKLVALVHLFNKQKLTSQSYLIELYKSLKGKFNILKYRNKSKNNKSKNNEIYDNKKTYKAINNVLGKINNYKVLKKNSHVSFNIVYNKLSSLFLEKETTCFFLEEETSTDDSFPYFVDFKNLFEEEDALLDSVRDLNFNTLKFSNKFLNLYNLGLRGLLHKVFKKKIELKVVDLKSVHLNSDIFSSTVALKLRDRENKAVRVLRKAILHMVKLPDLHTLITFDDNKPLMNKSNILNTIDQQVVSGVRFEAAGRLTKRLTAMRAVFKYRYVGSLKNIRSSFNSKPSTILRGAIKSNAQYTIINSKTRNGTFGLKGWVSAH